MTTVTALSWIPRAFARTPQTAPQPAQTVDEVRKKKGAHDDLAEFNMDSYDDEDAAGMQFFSVLEEDSKLIGKDEYLKGVDVDSGSDAEDDEICATDLVFAAASAEEDHCSLEVYIYSEEDNALYVRHDMLLDAYPLATSFVGGEENSFVAVGNFDSVIHLWDPHVEDSMEPTVSLGMAMKALKEGKKSSKGGKKKKKGAEEIPHGTHTEAVLALDTSPHKPGVLASASADSTVRLWDCAAEQNVQTFTYHEDKVQCARWHPTEPAGLLTAGFDRWACALDVRAEAGQPQASFALPSDAESASWLRHAREQFVVSCEDGNVLCFDVRKPGAALWTLAAHSMACTAVRDTACPQMLVTASLDETARIWKMDGAAPKLIFERNLAAGPIFSCVPCEDEPRILAFTGKCVVVWDVTDTPLVADGFDIQE
jgi:periodic tryptophan protein 1